ncbi:MAG TPA: type II toxin-antitoxin system HicA family toxin [Terriglobales bacterium]
MKVPRDLSGIELEKLLQRYGYEATRQHGSHMRLTSTFRGTEHHITIPAHQNLKVGTLESILTDVADYLALPRSDFEQQLFAE